jgi:2-oxo-4-hydroxy-4-carboxy-5-ureidoimidazoline decarboxylase
MNATRYTLEQLNAMPQEAFVATLSGVFEHSPWVPREAGAARPFASVDELYDAMVDVVARADVSRQLALIDAHPELAGKAAVRGELSAESMREQSGAGLSQCTREELDKLRRLNCTYRQKFGFPFILAVRGYDCGDIIAHLEARMNNGYDEELRANLQQIYRIARFRIDDLVAV